MKSYLAALSILLFGSLAEAAFLPVNQPEYRFLYEAARRQEILDGKIMLREIVAPFNLDTSLNGFARNHFTSSGNDKIEPFIALGNAFNASRYDHSRNYESIRGGLYAHPTRHLYYYGNLLLDKKMAEDPSYTGKKWRGMAGEMESSYLAFGINYLDIIGGRFGGNWGPSDESLILSSTARPMDAVAVRLRWGIMQFSYQAGQLNKIGPADSTGEWQNRYFSGHRLDFQFASNFSLGLFETVIYGGAGRSFEMAYLNPFMIYHSVQLNDNIDDNTFLGLDAVYLIAGRHKLYGQFLIDDFQIEKKIRSDREPNELGFLIGAQSLNLFNFIDIKGEYLRLNNRTYNQKYDRNRYDNRGALIGNELGPDADRWSLTLSKWFGYERRLSLNFACERHGEGRYNSPWTEPWLDSTIVYKESFPTGTVEKKFTAGIGFSGFIRNDFYFDGEGGIRIYRNFGHNPGASRTVPYFSFNLIFSFSHPVKIQ
ncbi:exported hypothetical protein [Candidatus Zixiibacteriota bacterium]|nr:exported hypothetical protein [candidate division Zixibacteria bacterium]